MSHRLLFLAMLLWLAFLFPTIRVVADATIDISTSAVFTRDQDTMWRCHANVTIKNTYSENMTLLWVSVLYINATFVDGTSEQLTGLAGGNITLNPPIVLEPEDKATLGVVATDSGFNKEPTIIWIYLTTSFFEISKPLAGAFPLVPEFPSFLILPLSIMVTLLAVIICKKTKLQKLKSQNLQSNAKGRNLSPSHGRRFFIGAESFNCHSLRKTGLPQVF